MKAIIDLVLVAVLILCTWSGYKKGLIMGVGGIIIILFSFISANIVTSAFYHDVTPALKPFASGFLEKVVSDEEGVAAAMDWGDTDLSLEDLLAAHPEDRERFYSETYRAIGITGKTADSMAQQVTERISESSSGTMEALSTVLCENISFAACFTLSFLLILIVFTVIGNLPNLSYKIPNLDLVNDISGAVLGLLTGMIFCVMIVWVLKFCGIVIGKDTLENTKLASWLLEKDFLLKYLGV